MLVFHASNVSHIVIIAPPPPRTITKEWEEAATERAKEMNINPITGK
jgi:cytochrome c oxidase subunit 4